MSVTFRRFYITIGSFIVLTLVWAPGQAADALILQPDILVIEAPIDPIVGIRTDWEIKFSTLNRKSTTPQIIAVLSPDGTVNGDYMILELNHSSLPSYSKGGLQIQIWNYDQEQTWSDVYFAGTECQTDTERIRFTMEMKLVDDVNSQTGKRLWFRASKATPGERLTRSENSELPRNSLLSMPSQRTSALSIRVSTPGHRRSTT